VAEIRRLGRNDGALLREVRLRALRDAPYAYSSWFAREAEFADEVWDDRVAQSDAGLAAAVFVAVEAERSVGMAGGYVHQDEPRTVTLWGSWVDPAARRGGIGRGLVEAVAAWARERGADQMTLRVTDTKATLPAVSLYRRLGFVETGEQEALGSHPSLVTVVMSRSL
jgi:ribosomal protein S18 acetylase RimI-like enzyme